MLAVIAYHSGDRHQAARLADWIAELGGCRGHRLLVLRDKSAPPIKTFAPSFDSLEEIVVTDDVWKSWPASPNNVFKKAAKHIQYTTAEPWVWLEPDVVPMRAGWLDEIAAEYAASGQPFLGDLVSVHTPELDVPDHCSGVAVYPGCMTDHAGAAVMQVEIAWDVAAADQILPLMTESELISHAWKHAPFADWEQVEREIFAIKPKCGLFHADKSGTLIELLRKQLRGEPGPVDAPNASVDRAGGAGDSSYSAGSSKAEHAPYKGEVDGSSPSPPTCDILIKSYPPDYELLRYCLRSIEKFATGFRRVLLIVPKTPENEYPFGTGFVSDKAIKIERIEVDETGEGYLFQQACKINAHEYTDADYILHIDSDTMMTRPVTPETFFRDGKPLWLMTPYEQTETPWRPFTEKFLGEPVDFEFMRRFPMLIPRSLHVSADVFCRVRHKMSLAQYILSQPHREFSEFNALGALAYSRGRVDFSWLDTTKEELPELVAIQRWSHEPLTDEIRAGFEKILSGGGAGRGAPDPSSKIGNVAQSEAPEPPRGRPAEISDSDAAAAIHQTAAGHWVITGDTHISKWVEEKGQLQHDFQTLPMILDEISEGDVVVDVGANIGDTTGPFLERVGPKGEVWAFEPDNDAFECLSRNCSKAYCYNVALDQYKGKSFSSLTRDMNAGARYLKQSEDGQPVTTITLDLVALTACDFIKIDVEGYELNVLRGAVETIDRYRPKMAIEINEAALQRQGTSGAEVFAWLAAHGYNFWPLVPPDRNQASPQYDILCKPNNLPVASDVKGSGAVPEEPECIGQTNLSGPVEAHGRGSSPERGTSAPPAQTPWANKATSIAEIKSLVARLKEFCGAPPYISLVRQELVYQRVLMPKHIKPWGAVKFRKKIGK